MPLQVSIDTDFYHFLSKIDQIIPDNARSPMHPLSARRQRHLHFSEQTEQLKYYQGTTYPSRKNIIHSRPCHDEVTKIDHEAISIARKSISTRIGAQMIQKDFPPQKPIRRGSNEA
jgi:hypothetical protein